MRTVELIKSRDKYKEVEKERLDNFKLAKEEFKNAQKTGNPNTLGIDKVKSQLSGLK
jgi:hypothetical protein